MGCAGSKKQISTAQAKGDPAKTILVSEPQTKAALDKEGISEATIAEPSEVHAAAPEPAYAAVETVEAETNISEAAVPASTGNVDMVADAAATEQLAAAKAGPEIACGETCATEPAVAEPADVHAARTESAVVATSPADGNDAVFEAALPESAVGIPENVADAADTEQVARVEPGAGLTCDGAGISEPAIAETNAREFIETAAEPSDQEAVATDGGVVFEEDVAQQRATSVGSWKDVGFWCRCA